MESYSPLEQLVFAVAALERREREELLNALGGLGQDAHSGQMQRFWDAIFRLLASSP